jgi:hypothetical protein
VPANVEAYLVVIMSFAVFQLQLHAPSAQCVCPGCTPVQPALRRQAGAWQGLAMLTALLNPGFEHIQDRLKIYSG